MRIVIYVLLGICAVLILVCYSMCVIAYDANERAERMYRRWKEQLEADMRENGEPLDSDYNVGIDHAICVLGTMKGADDE